MPKELSSDQQSAVEEMSKVFNGDPRARLFAGSASTRAAPAPPTQEAGDGAS